MNAGQRSYSAYGLTISSNRLLPGVPAKNASQPDVTIEFRAERLPVVEPAARGWSGDYGWQSHTRLQGGSQQFLYAASGGERAWSMQVSADGRHLEVRWTETMDLRDILAVVVTRGLAGCLAARGVPLLHACVIATETGAVAVMGPRGAGKSTIGAAAVASGLALVADDMATLDESKGRVHVWPGVQSMRLDARTAKAMGWDAATLPRVFTDPMVPDKRSVALSPSGGGFCNELRPLQAIYLLGPRTAGGPKITPLPPPRALPHLLRNTFADEFLDLNARAALLPFWARVASTVPVSELQATDNLDALPGVLGAIGVGTRTAPGGLAR